MSAGEAAWALWQDSPWGRLRYHVVARLLRSWTADLGDGLRVLDAGGGDGRDALPFALAGHEVTVLDRSPEMLRLARAKLIPSAYLLTPPPMPALSPPEPEAETADGVAEEKKPAEPVEPAKPKVEELPTTA